MRLADHIAQCSAPFLVQDLASHAVTRLSGAADFAAPLRRCATRYVLSDELTRLCAALAFSKGARSLCLADILRFPAQRLWIEWCEKPWLAELQLFGFRPSLDLGPGGRRGAWIESSLDGRRGLIRTFWTLADDAGGVQASSMEAYFDLDTAEHEEPSAPDGRDDSALCVSDDVRQSHDILRRCFRFRYENTWADYYRRAALQPQAARAVALHALGTIAADIPMLCAFFLLLSTRHGLPQRDHSLKRLNRSRMRDGKSPLLDHTEVLAPVFECGDSPLSGSCVAERRAPRLHHVRGHLVRHGSQLFWRVPHLRGNPRWGTLRARTVTWTVDPPTSRARGASASEGLAQ